MGSPGLRRVLRGRRKCTDTGCDVKQFRRLDPQPPPFSGLSVFSNMSTAIQVDLQCMEQLYGWSICLLAGSEGTLGDEFDLHNGGKRE